MKNIRIWGNVRASFGEDSPMSDIRDFYQRLVSLPNLFKGFKKGDEARKVLREMQDLLEKADQALLKRGQKEYAEAIKARCDHLYRRAEEIFTNQLQSVMQGALVVPSTDDSINHLRDLYHYLYYTLFYLGRYVLVLEGEVDNSHHDEMAKSLNKYIAGKRISNNNAATLADLLKARIEEFSLKRDSADYKINSSAIKELEVVTNIQNDFEVVKDLWGKSNNL